MADGQMGIHIREGSLVLGFDPGRDKTGFAFVNLEGGLLLSGIFPTTEHAQFFSALHEREALSVWTLEGSIDALPDDVMESVLFVAVGNGTHSREFTQLLHDNLPCETVSVDEKNTTLEARKLYWQLHTPSLLMRLLPKGLRVPARVLDDLAAWSIALRAVKKYRDIRPNKL